MMYITRALLDSSRLLWTKSGWLLLLVTLKTLVYAYKAWALYWGWVAALLVAGSLLTIHYCDSLPFITDQALHYSVCDFVSEYIFSCIYAFVFLTMVLVIRPSVARKTYAYYAGYVRYALPLLITFVLLGAMFFVFETMASFLNMHTTIWLYVINGVHLLAVPLLIFFLSFLFDTDGSIFSFVGAGKRACKMLAYTAFLVVVTSLLLNVIQGLFLQGILFVLIRAGLLEVQPDGSLHMCTLLCGVLLWSVQLLLLPVWIALYSNIYIKNLYDHMERYFPR